MAGKPEPDVRAECTTCGRLKIDHRAGPCPYCFGPLDHHGPGMLDACREGKARMASARVAAGVPLTDSDRRALEPVA
jgi:hypothetical protein